MKIKYRQPLFDTKGNFKEWHYWGVMAITDDGVEQWVAPLTRKLPYYNPEQSQSYTGRKDMNGEEIYLGDKNQDGGVVEWNEDDASFVWVYAEIETTAMGEEDTWCKIVGNIFENKSEAHVE